MDNKKIKKLETYFKKKNYMPLAFLFGSRTKEPRNVSDWDIAIYVNIAKTGKNIEKTETKIWTELIDIVNCEVDLILLNSASSLLAYKIVAQGLPLKISDRKLYLKLLLGLSYDADYFLKFYHEYYQIYQRSYSLNEIDKARLEKILIFLENELKDFEKFKKLTYKEYALNISKKREVERWIETMINSVLDIAKIILASSKKPLPDTYKKIITEISLVPGYKFCTEIEKWIELRNILAHEYIDILWVKINNFLKNAYPYMKKYLDQTKSYINTN